MNPAIILGLVRHVLTIGAGALASRGVIGENDAETVVGAILALVGVLWSALDKRGR